MLSSSDTGADPPYSARSECPLSTGDAAVRESEVRFRYAAIAFVFALGGGCDTQPDGKARPPGLEGNGSRSLGEAHVLVFSEPWRSGCGSGCWNAYLDYIVTHAKHARPLLEPLDEVLAEPFARLEPQTADLEADQLGSEIVGRLNIGFLLSGLRERLLAVAVLSEEVTSRGVTQQKLLFWDPEVGSFEGYLLVPPGDGPHPAIVGLHGHGDTDNVFATEYLGEQLAERGFAVLMPRLRVHNCSRNENRVARELLEKGFTLIGLHVYETLLMVKYLDALAEIDTGRLGIISHSGGSSIANLVVRISDRFRAQVTDYRVDYRNRCGPRGVHCETVPELGSLAANINDSATLSIPSLVVPYGYADPGSKLRILLFFDEVL
jgi:dienelactone hydrolase